MLETRGSLLFSTCSAVLRAVGCAIITHACQWRTRRHSTPISTVESYPALHPALVCLDTEQSRSALHHANSEHEVLSTRLQAGSDGAGGGVAGAGHHAVRVAGADHHRAEVVDVRQHVARHVRRRALREQH